MFTQIIDTLGDVMHRGGWVMYPLIILSIIALTLIFERCWFWLATNNPGRRRRYQTMARYLREGRHQLVRDEVADDRSVYGQLVRAMLDSNASEAVVRALVEKERPRIERFMPTLGTIITAAPMLGILGTVTGIIQSFRVLSQADMVTDPTAIGAGIAEALLTTVAGLVVALVVLFPYNAFRAQIDRTLGLAEALVAAAKENNSPPPG